MELSIDFVLDEGATSPTKKHSVDAGWDFYSNEDVVLPCSKIDFSKLNKWAEEEKKYYSSFELSYVIRKQFYELISSLSFSPAPIIVVDTGVKVAIPKGFGGMWWDRSGMSCQQHITHVGGLLDTGYTGNFLVGLVNLGQEDYHIKKGDRIIQLVFLETPLHVLWNQVDSLKESERGEGKFGSTDEK